MSNMWTEEKEWIIQYQTGDLKALKELKISFHPLVREVARETYWNTSKQDVTLKQLINRADGYLPSLFQKYNPEEGQPDTFLKNQLQSLLKNSIKEETDLSALADITIHSGVPLTDYRNIIVNEMTFPSTPVLDNKKDIARAINSLENRLEVLQKSNQTGRLLEIRLTLRTLETLKDLYEFKENE